MKKFGAFVFAIVFICMAAGSAVADYVYYIPYFSSNAGESTGLGLRNGSLVQNANITVITYDNNGTQLSAEQYTLPARGQSAFFIGQGAGTDGSLRVTSDQPLVGIVITVLNNWGYLADIPMIQNISKTLCVPQAADDNEWNSTIIVSNPQNSATTVTLTYVNQTGSADTPFTDNISANGIGKYDLSEIIDAVSVSGGSVEITATQDVAAVVLYSNVGTGGSYFTGIAAVDPTAQTENYSPTQFAVVATVAADWSSGAHSLIPADKPRIPQNNLLPTISDIGMAAYGRYFYRIERFMADNVTKFDINAPTTPIWQYSTLGDDLSSNPYGLIFVSNTKAYLLRYGTTTAWVVNPSAASEAEFKIGELDLSAYGDADGLPEMNAGVIVGNKLFITMQRLDQTNNWIAGTAYVAVFNTTTDTEIDTRFLGGGELMGISLPIKNPGTILYLADNNTLYVQGVGGFESSWSGIPADYSGGIASIDPGNYETTMILDDGDDNDHPYGNISGLQIASTTKGYFIGYAGWGDNTLYSFDPSTGEVDGAVAGLENKNISGMESGAYIDNNNMLWICNQTDAEVVLLDTGDDTIDERISTNLNPRKVVFCEP